MQTPYSESLNQEDLDAEPLHAVDGELLPFFCEEAFEILQRAHDGLRGWDAGQPDPVRLRDMTREFHTLKSAARSVGLATVGQAAYEVETLLKRAQEKESVFVPGTALVGLLEITECFRRILEAAASGRHDPDPLQMSLIRDHVFKLGKRLTPSEGKE